MDTAVEPAHSPPLGSLTKPTKRKRVKNEPLDVFQSSIGNAAKGKRKAEVSPLVNGSLVQKKSKKTRKGTK